MKLRVFKIFTKGVAAFPNGFQTSYAFSSNVKHIWGVHSVGYYGGATVVETNAAMGEELPHGNVIAKRGFESGSKQSAVSTYKARPFKSLRLFIMSIESDGTLNGIHFSVKYYNQILHQSNEK